MMIDTFMIGNAIKHVSRKSLLYPHNLYILPRINALMLGLNFKVLLDLLVLTFFEDRFEGKNGLRAVMGTDRSG